ncbi:MAG: hypothetical protein WCK89_24065, partial [bacterium]
MLDAAEIPFRQLPGPGWRNLPVHRRADSTQYIPDKSFQLVRHYGRHPVRPAGGYFYGVLDTLPRLLALYIMNIVRHIGTGTIPAYAGRCWLKSDSLSINMQRGLPFRVRTFSATCLSLVLFGVPTLADSIVTAHWIGGDGNWSDSTHWDIGTVPNNSGPTQYAVIAELPGPAVTITIDQSV